MELIYIACFTYVFSVVKCYSDSESAEINRVEVTPFYDTIIYSDIADILNDFENNGISPIDLFTDSESQSDEKVEGLLTEYQHYLEKAQKQRKNYVEKTKPKNKVPLLRHDQFTKMKPGSDYKRNDLYYNAIYRPSGFNIEHAPFNNPLDVFIPINARGKYLNKLEMATVPPKSRADLLTFKNIIFNDKNIFDLSPAVQNSPKEPIKSDCFCRNGYFPCECNCKQCIIPNEPLTRDQKNRSPDELLRSSLQYPSIFDNPLRKYSHNINDNKYLAENTLNIRIKVDLQLPKLQETFGKYKTSGRTFEGEDIISKELSTAIKLPFTYFNFPVNMKYFDTKKPRKLSKDDTGSQHKMTVHKKRKSRINHNNKKQHKHQKIITIHNIKLDSQPLYSMQLLDNVTNTYDNKSEIINSTTEQPSTIIRHEIATTLNKTIETGNDIQTEESIYLMLNISNDTYSNTEQQSQTDDNHKFENSIEIDFTKMVLNVTTTKPPTMRTKREVTNINKGVAIKSDETLNYSLYITPANVTISEKNIAKKPDKNLLSDAELLYWPNVVRNKTNTFNKKNITTIIMENENKKTKLNMNKDSIRQNHTKALERAIFGDVNWDDIDTVAPAFMSFVGKYVHGILTFCSVQVCHSMNCADKICLHRICQPTDRLNNKGHCAGSNNTDGVASMESIMDLPSNIALEIVDILQDRLLGKIFGKATFCINSKCITLMASKKIFIKSRCTIKDLNIAGHCSIIKH